MLSKSDGTTIRILFKQFSRVNQVSQGVNVDPKFPMPGGNQPQSDPIEEVAGHEPSREEFLQHVGGFSDGKARSSWSVVVGSGTEDLTSLQGEGSYVAGHGEPAQASFKYSFAPNA